MHREKGENHDSYFIESVLFKKVLFRTIYFLHYGIWRHFKIYKMSACDYIPITPPPPPPPISPSPFRFWSGWCTLSDAVNGSGRGLSRCRRAKLSDFEVGGCVWLEFAKSLTNSLWLLKWKSAGIVPVITELFCKVTTTSVESLKTDF